MEDKTPSEVVKLIRTNTLRIRNGLWLLPSTSLGQERNEAARLLVEGVDLRQELVQYLPAGTHFIGLTEQKVIELLDKVAEGEGQSDCALIYNLDLLLARLKQHEIKILSGSILSNLCRIVPAPY